MKKLPKDAEASNILIGELDELIVSNIISFLFLWDNFLLTNNRIYARMFNYKTSMPTCISDVVGYPKTRNPRGKTPTFWYPNPKNGTRTPGQPEFCTENPDYFGTRPEPDFCYPTTPLPTSSVNSTKFYTYVSLANAVLHFF